MQGINVLNREISRFLKGWSLIRRSSVQGLVGLAVIASSVSGQDSYAAKIANLYDAEIPVFSQSRADRHVAIKRAFAEVLLRVSGQQDVVLALPPLTDPDAEPLLKTPNQEQPNLVLVGKTADIAAALNQATRYVKQFRYQKPTGKPHIDWGIKLTKTQQKKAPKTIKQVLWIRFNKKKINTLLHQAGLPVWGKTRPSILVWMVVESRSKRYLLSNSIKSTTRATIEKYARLYGLPVRFPLMDLADRANITTADVWGNFEDRVVQASKRYQSEAILVGKLYIANRSWNTRWSLYVDGRRVDWGDQNIKLEKVVKLGLSHVAQNLSQTFADVQTEQGTQQILVEVKDVSGLVDYTQTEKYLTSISSVKKLQVVKLNQHSVLFKLTTQGSRIGVMQAISLGSLLAAEPITIPKVLEERPLNNIALKINNNSQENKDVINQSVSNVAIVKTEKLVPDLIYRLLK